MNKQISRRAWICSLRQGRCLWLFVVLGVSALSAYAETGGHQLSKKPGQAILDPVHPQDSRGEAVYQPKGASDDSTAVVPGALIAPRLVHSAKPKYPSSLREKKAKATVTVRAVVAENGDLIDAAVSDAVADDVAAAALEALSKYRFDPATLDGKPVAVSLRVVIQFRIF